MGKISNQKDSKNHNIQTQNKKLKDCPSPPPTPRITILFDCD